MSPTREAYESKFNNYMDILLTETKKETTLEDVYDRMEEILMELRNQSTAMEGASYQAAL